MHAHGYVRFFENLKFEIIIIIIPKELLNKKSNDHLTNNKTFCREIWLHSRAALKSNEVDVHTRLMRKYKDIPQWWFLMLTMVGIAISIATVEGYKLQLQLPSSSPSPVSPLHPASKIVESPPTYKTRQVGLICTICFR
jgi:hypothetical protein